MSEVLWVNSQEEFDEVLADNHYVVVDFTAPSWCRPCQQFAPHFDAAASSAAIRSDIGQTNFVAVDVDNAPWAMVEYGVRGVPTVKLFEAGTFKTDLKARTAVKLLAEIQGA